MDARKVFVEDLIARKDTVATAAIFRDWLLDRDEEERAERLRVIANPKVWHASIGFELKAWMKVYASCIIGGKVTRDTLHITDRAPCCDGWFTWTSYLIPVDRSEVPEDILKYLVGYIRSEQAEGVAYHREIPDTVHEGYLARACWDWGCDQIRITFGVAPLKN